MTEFITSAIVTGLGLWLILGALSIAVYPFIRAHLRKLHPAQGSTLLLCWLAFPFVSSVIISTALYWPQVARWLINIHCHASGCSQHGPSTPLAWLPAIILLCWTFFCVLRCCWQHYLPALKLKRQLTNIATAQTHYYELPSPLPEAFTLGWWQPKIFITRGLRERCEPGDITCIVEHELGHLQRSDNLRHLLAWIFTAPLPQRWLQPLFDDHRFACERACDLIACCCLPPERVAETLLRVARFQSEQVSHSGSSAFANNHTEARVQALLSDLPEKLNAGKLLCLGSLVFLMLILLVNPIHRLLEWFL